MKYSKRVSLDNPDRMPVSEPPTFLHNHIHSHDEHALNMASHRSVGAIAALHLQVRVLTGLAGSHKGDAIPKQEDNNIAHCSFLHPRRGCHLSAWFNWYSHPNITSSHRPVLSPIPPIICLPQLDTCVFHSVNRPWIYETSHVISYYVDITGCF